MDQQDGGSGGSNQQGVSHDQTSKIFGVMRDAAVSANSASLNFRILKRLSSERAFNWMLSTRL